MRVFHLRNHREEGPCAAIREDQGRNSCNGLGEGGIPNQFVVRFPFAVLRGSGGSVLNAYCYYNREDCADTD